MFRSIVLFVFASLLEIGGGYLVWLWVKSGKPVWYLLAGIFCLGLYGIVAALQSKSFGRVYAAYSGIFLVLSLTWAAWMDGFRPDKYDLLGAGVALIGIFIMMYTPRS